MRQDIVTYHRYHDSRGRSWHGSDQVAISAKIDSSIYNEMDKEMMCSGIKRNRLLNLAVKWYLQELDEARMEQAKIRDGHKYILNIDTSYFTGEELEKLKFISRGMGTSEAHIVCVALRRMLKDYDNNPMSYMG